MQCKARNAGFVVFSILTIFLSLLRCGGQKQKNELRGSGQIEATEVQVAPLVTGLILELPLERGDAVKLGDLVARIDPSEYKIRLLQARGQLGEAEARLGLMVAGSRKEDIRRALEQLNEAEAELEAARTNRKRVEEVFRKGSATAGQMDDADTRLKVAEASAGAARQNYERQLRGSRKQEIEAAAGAAEAMKAQVALVEKNIRDCTVPAPISGTVTEKVREAGEYVSAGSPLVTLAVLDPVNLIIYLPESVLGRVRLGQEASVTIDSYPGRTFPGKVIFVSPEAEFTPHDIQTREERVKLVYAVKIEVRNPDGIFKPGMPAEAELTEK
jgi:HlyD family secretion protein